MMVKKVHVVLISAIVVLMLLVAVPGFAQVATPVPANEFEITGTVTALTTTSVTINGLTIQITGAEIKSPISVGTLAKVHYSVNANGVRVARELGQALAPSLTGTPNSPDDDFEREITGAVSAITGTTITVDNQVIDFSGAEIKDSFSLGSLVKVHYSVGANGALVAREVELALHFGSDDDNSDDRNDDHGGSSNSSSSSSNDDNGGSNNSSSNSSNNSNSGSGSSDDDDDDRGGNSGHGSDDDDDDNGGNSGHGSDDNDDGGDD